jgi:hypothetical protein
MVLNSALVTRTMRLFTDFFETISGVTNSKHVSELRQTAALLMRGEVEDEGKGQSVWGWKGACGEGCAAFLQSIAVRTGEAKRNELINSICFFQ